MEPTLSEIVNMKVDGEVATGTPAVVYNSKDLIANLNSAAQYKAENDWRKYNMFMGNLKEVYKDLNEIAKQPVLTEDREALKQKMADIVKGISSDPHGFFGGGQKYQETLANIAALQGEATESKQNSLYDTAHRQYFYANPELDTPENRAMLDGFRGQKLGTRQPYLLKLPSIFDAKTIADQLAIATKDAGFKEFVTPDQKFLQKDTWVKYDPNIWNEKASQFYKMQDKKGGSISAAATEAFNKLPQYLKDSYKGSKDPIYDFYLDSVNAYKPKDTLSTDLKENQIYINAEAQKAANYRAKLNENGANYRANLPYQKAKEAADAANNFGNIIYGVNVPNILIADKNAPWSSNKKSFSMINGAIVDKDGYIQNNIDGEFNVPATGVNNSIVTEFNKYAGQTRLAADGTVLSTPTTSKIEPSKDGNIIIRVKGGRIVGVKTADGTFADEDQFQYITTMTSQKGASKYRQPEDISGGAGLSGGGGAPVTDPTLLNKLNSN